MSEQHDEQTQGKGFETAPSGPPLPGEDAFESVPMYRRPRGAPGLEVLAVPRSKRTWTFLLEQHAVGLVVGRGFELRAGRWRANLDVANVVSVAAGDVFKTTPRDTWAGAVGFFFDPETVASAAQELDIDGPVRWGGRQTYDSLTPIFQALTEAVLNEDDELTVGELQARALNGLLAGAESRPSHDPARVEIAKSLLQEQYARSITLADLTEATGASRFQLIRAFNQHVGLPPHQYLMRVRLARAKTLLAGGMRCAQAARLTGFCDESHLTRNFGRAFGVTPGRYRESLQPAR